MATGNTVSTDALRPEIWSKDLYQDVEDGLYFVKNGMMGKDTNNVIQLKDELSKEKGDTITMGLTTKMSGNGVTGDSELEGQEEVISPYSEAIAISQKRFAVRLTGRLDEQKNGFDMRKDAKDKLAIRLQEFIEMQMFLKLGGLGIATLTDISGTVVSADYAWSNTPDTISATDTAAGYGARYICADYTNGADGLAATEIITPELISRARIKAMVAAPKIQPLRIDGKNYYVLFVHPYQAFDIKRSAEWTQAQREAQARGKDNPIFTGALGVWDSVILHEHEYAPWLDISVVGYSFTATATGTQYGADCARALLCGRQAAVFAKCKNDNAWVEETFDYKNKVGFGTGLIGGIQKVMFNSKEYGVVAVDTGITSLV